MTLLIDSDSSVKHNDDSKSGLTSTVLNSALQKCGINNGDTVFVHVSLDELSQTPETTTERNEMVLSALRSIVGEEGTILVPTYTFSFCNRETFDVDKTPTPGGPWSTSADFLEMFRNLPGVLRSTDPIHSVAGLGPRAKELLSDIPNTCFGKDSVFDRLLQADGKICMIGPGLEEATFRHYVEELVGVPFRFKKLFTGYIKNGDVQRKTGWIHNVRIMAENGYPDGTRLERMAIDAGKCRIAQLGAGEIKVVGCRDYFDLTRKELETDPWLTAKGPVADIVELEQERVGGPDFGVSLSENASESELMDKLWSLPRDIVSDGYDVAMEALATQVPMTIHEYKTGTEVWDWIVPEKWTCHEAYLETMDGRRLFSHADNPLHVISYSLPFDGVVSRDVLLKHLYVHPKIADAIPFIFKYYERDWGLCCSKTLRDSLNDEEYRVVIKTDFSYSTLKVGEVVIPGESEETIVLCSHLCHPHQANDDLTGVIVGIKVAQELLRRKNLRYTYRYLIVPETIGSIAYLSHNPELVPKIKGGMFLEMLGLDYPHGLQLSFQGNTELDLCFTLAMKQLDHHSWTGPFRTVIGNDERQFNGPGMRIPFLSLSRVLPPSSPNWPYREYHSSFDNPDLVSIKHLEDSRDLVLSMIDTLESNHVPVNRFNGEPFCSRYGLHVDWYSNPEGHNSLFNILDRIDGTRSIAEIAKECGVSFDSVNNVVAQLLTHELIEIKAAA
jgi:aminopeptidase-like protein/aminoglycoside N3'-acetyltransferase